MSVVIESPLSSQVFGPMPDTLSPPPTPVAKRSRHFFPSEASTPTPMFFPRSKSILSGRGGSSSSSSSSSSQSPSEKENAELRRQLERLASRPAPALRLRPRPRPTDVTNQAARPRLSPRYHDQYGPGPLVKRKVTAEQVARVPALPFAFAEEEGTADPPRDEKPAAVVVVDAASIPELPSMSSSPAPGSPAAAAPVARKTTPLAVKRSSVPQPQPAKLPAFQRGGMRVVSRRNSYVARSA